MKLISQAKMFALTATSAVALLAASSAHAQFGGSGTPAQETVTIGVTVDNLLDLTVDSDVVFGTVASYVDDTDLGTLTIAPDGTVTGSTTTDGFVVVADDSTATAGQITIVGAAPNSTLNIHPVTTNQPENAGESFNVTQYTFEIGASSTNTTSGTNTTLTADGDFATDETLLIGIQLTQNSTGADYLMADGAFNGDFTIDIGY